MKKILIIIILFLLVLTGCNKEVEIQKESDNNKNTYSYTYMGVDVTPGANFDKTKINNEYTFSTIPSCAFEGQDNVYTYNDVEITTNENNGVEKVYSIYFLDETPTTDKGVRVSDEMSVMPNAYGTNYKSNDNEYIYTDGNMDIKFILSEGMIISIEQVLVIE